MSYIIHSLRVTHGGTDVYNTPSSYYQSNSKLEPYPQVMSLLHEATEPSTWEKLVTTAIFSTETAEVMHVLLKLGTHASLMEMGIASDPFEETGSE